MPLRFENGEDKLEKFMEVFNFQEIADKISEKSLIDIFTSLSIQILKSLTSLDTWNYLTENLKEILSFISDSLLKDLLGIEENKEFHDLISSAFKKDSNSSIAIISEYLNQSASRLSTNEVFSSTLIYRKIGKEILNTFSQILIKEREGEVIEIFTNFLKEHQEQQFKIYFFDWILKIGYLLEAKIKDLLLVKAKFKCMIEGKDFQESYKNENLNYIGNLLKFLKEKNLLANYRNSIFHADFAFNYDIDYDKRKILLKELKGKIIPFDVDEIVSLFFDLMERTTNYEQILIALFLKQDKVHELIKDSFQPHISQEDIEELEAKFRDLDEDEFKFSFKNKFKDFFSDI